MKKAFIIIGSVFLIFINFAALTTAADTDSLVVDTNGKVGIGTTTPWSKLSIRVDGLNEGSDVQSGSGWIRFMPGTLVDYAYNNLSRAGDNGIIFSAGSLNTGNLVIGPHSNLEVGIKILSNGKVGIGTANPWSKLSIRVDGLNEGSDVQSGSGWIRFMPGTLVDYAYNNLTRAGDNGIIFSAGSLNTGNLVIGPHSNLEVGIKILSNGNVGIGTTTPQYTLDVNGDIRGNNFIPSDARWKENFETLDNALNLVTLLRGVSYDWIDPSRGEGRQIGVIAQEVEQVLPEVVHTDSQGYKSVEYAKLVAPLIEAVKELKTKNERLEAENQSMKQSLQEILSRLDALEE